MLAGIVIAVLVLLASQAAAVESCPGVFRDVVLGVPGDEVSRVSVVIRSGIVVLQQQNQSSTNVTVLLRSSATDAELLEAAIGTAQFTDGIIVIKGCPREGSDSDCLSSKMKGSPAALVLPLLPLFFGGILLAEAAPYSGCATSAVTVSIPTGWRGSIDITTESADVSFNSPLNFSSLSVETWSGHVASIWEAPLAVDGRLSIVSRESSSTVYLARTLMTGKNGQRCLFEARGIGQVTTSFIDFPGIQTACGLAVDVGGSGTFDAPNLRGIDGRFRADIASGSSGEISMTGAIVSFSTNTATTKEGTVGTGLGLHSIKASSSGGKAVIFCRSAAV